jgi:hypothetical protein
MLFRSLQIPRGLAAPASSVAGLRILAAVAWTFLCRTDFCGEFVFDFCHWVWSSAKCDYLSVGLYAGSLDRVVHHFHSDRAGFLLVLGLGRWIGFEESIVAVRRNRNLLPGGYSADRIVRRSCAGRAILVLNRWTAGIGSLFRQKAVDRDRVSCANHNFPFTLNWQK